VGSQRRKARSNLIRSERCNNNTKVVMSVVDIVVYEDDRTRLSEWRYQHRRRVPKWVGKGEILGVVIYV